MTNKELEKKLCSAFEEATPDVLDSVLADCRKEQKTMITFRSSVSNWNIKFAISAVAAILVICLSVGWSGLTGIGPSTPTDPYQTGTQPTVSDPTDSIHDDVRSVSWKMTATLIQPDGTFIKTYPMTVNGTIKDTEPYDYLKLDIKLEGDFRFMFKIPEPDGYISTNGLAQWPGDYTTEGFCYDKTANAPALVAWAVNTEKEYFIAWFGEEFGNFLVASIDPTVPPEEIMAHFELLVNYYKPTEPEPTDPEPTDPEPTDPQPTDPNPTEPTVPVGPDGLPTDLNTDADMLSKFQELFSCKHPGNNYFNMALYSIFEDASGIGLKDLFYNGFDGESRITNEEKEALKAYTWDGELEITRCPADKMSDVLDELFGLSLWDFNEDALAHHPQLKDFVYLESTNSYYLFHNDGLCAHSFEAVGFRTMLNGNTALYYMYEDGYVKGVVTLKPYGDSYQIVSNDYIKDYNNDGVWPLLVDALPDVPEPSVPDYFPADMNTDAEVVAEFQKLFDNDSWYTQALRTEFDDPRNIGLADFLFCDMKPWPYTKLTMEETEKLRQQFGITNEWWVDCYSMEAATVEEVLQTVFGYSMADFMDSYNPYIVYLESTDCYYYGRTDSSLVQNVSVAGIRELENGNIEVYYTCDRLYPENGFVTLKPNGDSYVIVSNSELK